MSPWVEYLDAGWTLTELRPGSKSPRHDGWQHRTPPTPFNVKALGAGLCHAYSGTCAIDIDDLGAAEKWLADKGISLADMLADIARVEIVGNPKNHGKLLYRLAEPLRSKKVIEHKRNIIDFRCGSAGGETLQDVLPSSIHPDTGQPYRWAYGDPVLGHWSQLPALPAALEALWRSLIGPATETQAKVDSLPAAISVTDLEAWLASKDPDMDREEWVKVGMRIHTATGGQGFYIWDNWSRKGEKYKGSTDLQAPWRSFRVDGGLGTGAILAEKLAAPTEFPVEEPSEFAPSVESTDMSAGAIAHRLLKPRLIFLSGQGRYYFLKGIPPMKELDEDGNQLLTSDNAVNVLFTKHMPRIVHPKSGAVSQRVPTEYLKEIRPTTVANIGFHPGEGRLFVDTDGQKYLNGYVPEIAEPLTPKPHELEAWEFLVNRIHNTDYRRWLMQFYAFILKRPGVKVMSAPLLYSMTPGTGKSTLMKLVPSLLFGKRWVRTVSSEALTGRFTGFLADSWFIVLDELKTNGGKYDRMQLANKMKPWITEPELEIERKGENHYMIRNRVQITATSNFEDAVQIDDDDRRWGVSELGGGTITAAEAADLYTGFLSTPRAAGVLRHIFGAVNLAGFDPAGQAPRTAGRTVMVSMGLSPWITKLVEAAAKREPPFDRDIFTLEAVRDMLLGHSSPSLRAVASLVKRPPFNAVTLRTDDGRLWCWRNAALWAKLPQADIKHHLDTGERLHAGLAWQTEVPVAIRLMAGDDAPPDPNADLLGKPDGR